ncbi:hypothetical protein QCD70_12590 [Agreia sp. PsM10]|uniref:hypothetical protein n=1 Tax=Agreia sp. PsM10 TaxID=3030533 RepID=UPI00263AF9BE|nr:hypothetical protein [Agreia sp. PsM10]MDN4641088.1 hypothetical protein [Agreia sp. PsM10]
MDWTNFVGIIASLGALSVSAVGLIVSIRSNRSKVYAERAEVAFRLSTQLRQLAHESEANSLASDKDLAVYRDLAAQAESTFRVNVAEFNQRAIRSGIPTIIVGQLGAITVFIGVFLCAAGADLSSRPSEYTTSDRMTLVFIIAIGGLFGLSWVWAMFGNWKVNTVQRAAGLDPVTAWSEIRGIARYVRSRGRQKLTRRAPASTKRPPHQRPT